MRISEPAVQEMHAATRWVDGETVLRLLNHIEDMVDESPETVRLWNAVTAQLAPDACNVHQELVDALQQACASMGNYAPREANGKLHPSLIEAYDAMCAAISKATATEQQNSFRRLYGPGA